MGDRLRHSVLLALGLLSAVALAGLLVACSVGPPQCPTVPKSSDEGFNIDPIVRVEIRNALRDLLRDSGSYEEESIIARPVFSEARDDGSRYYTRVEVEFRAKNAFGGVVPGYAYVELSEDADEGCTVIGATLAEE